MARILIAEDDLHAGEMIARICRFKGHETCQARDAVHALGQIEGFAPDLIITDLAMPLGGGQHLVRELRSVPAWARIPVIVVTGYAAMLGQAERDALQPCTILEKPLELEPLLSALDEAVSASASRAASDPATDAPAPAAHPLPGDLRPTRAPHAEPSTGPG
jgi:CheY-like chemotaxis protein